MTVTPLPTRKDEAWRYAAIEKLQAGALDDTVAIDVDAGETRREILVISDDNPDEKAIQRLVVRVGEGARFELFGVIASRDYARIDVDVTLARGAHFEMGGITVGGRDTVREFVTRTVHAEPEGSSNQTVRAVHWGKGTGNFLGEIDVVRHAQKTNAAQDFKGLLLEKGASVNAVPQLEIFADDVQCAHGAAVGQLDEAARYYMAARGLPPEAARRLLVQAFIGDAMVALDDDTVREQLMQSALVEMEGQMR